MKEPLSARLGRVLLALVCAAGAAAGGFLLLCGVGVVSPGEVSQQVAAWLAPAEAAAPASAAPAQPVPAEEEEPFQGVFLPLEDLDRATELAAGKDGVVLPMKDPDGSLGYVSAVALAADVGASSGDPDRNEALRSLNDTPGLYTVAQVSCLRDGALVAAEPDLGLHRVSGAPWRDEAGHTWLDPTQETVQTYLIGLCRELADLGFDEILLTHCAYPTQGETDTLRDTAEREAALATFCRRLQGALADFDVTLSLQGQGDWGEADAPSGQTTGLLATFGRVWAAEADQAALAAFDPVLLPEQP
ncbi:putative glycoside hydrolase [Evtepia sp.]